MSVHSFRATIKVCHAEKTTLAVMYNVCSGDSVRFTKEDREAVFRGPFGVLEQVPTPRLYFVLNGKAVWPGNLPANFQAR